MVNVWAHRGASAKFLENSEPAFTEARRLGVFGVECDVRLCASGEVVVCHDDDLKRIAGQAVVVAERPWSELRRIDLGRGERLLLLQEVFEVVGPRLRVNVELKITNGRVSGLEQAVLDAVQRSGSAERTLVSCFHPMPLIRLRKLAPQIPRALIYGRDLAFPWRRGWHSWFTPLTTIHPQYNQVDRQRLSGWRDRGLEVNVWTVDASEVMQQLCQLGVDGLITSRPQLALAIARQYN